MDGVDLALMAAFGQLGAFQNHLNGLKTEQKWDVIYVDGFHEEQATLHMVDTLAQHASMGVWWMTLHGVRGCIVRGKRFNSARNGR